MSVEKASIPSIISQCGRGAKGKERLETTFSAMQTLEIRLDTTESTMETAKTILDEQDFLLVTSEEQTQGKGTRGRAWHGITGNAFLTIGINRRHLSNDRLRLLPLEMGLHLWNETAAHIAVEMRPHLTLKWPNDLMFQDAKAGGILMEGCGNFMLVGIGINIIQSPPITDGGGPTAYLASAGMDSMHKNQLIEGIYRRIISHSEGDSILVDWQSKMNWNRMHRLRDRQDQPLVKPISINHHGHLQIEHLDGSREWLVADYLV